MRKAMCRQRVCKSSRSLKSAPNLKTAAMTVGAFGVLLFGAVASQACHDNTPNVAGADMTEDPIIIADGTVTESAVDAVLPGVAGAWAHRREYSSQLESTMPIEGKGWKVDCLSAFLSPVNDDWKNAGDWHVYADALKSRIIAYNEDTEEYECPDSLRATFEHVDNFEGDSYFKLEFPRTGQKYYFADGSWTTGDAGALKIEMDAYNNRTTYGYDQSTRRITTIITEQGWYVQYTYIALEQVNGGMISQMDVYDGNPNNGANVLQRVNYTYYASGAGYSSNCGSDGDLIMVENWKRTSAGALGNKRTTMYRYYAGLEGYANLDHKLKTVFSPATVEELLADSGKTDEDMSDLLGMDDDHVVVGTKHLADYANVKCTYYTDPGEDQATTDLREQFDYAYGLPASVLGRVKTQTIKKDYKGAIGTHTFYYWDHALAGPPGVINNVVQHVTVEEFGDRLRLYGTNQDRFVIREVTIADGTYWCRSLWRGEARTNHNDPNVENKVVAERNPSAHKVIIGDAGVTALLNATIEAALDLVALTATDALIRRYEYDARGFQAGEKIQKKGDASTYVSQTVYGTGTSTDGVPQYLPKETRVYTSPTSVDTDPTKYYKTTIEYEFYDSDQPVNARHMIRQKTITKDAIVTGENGSNVAVVTQEYYDNAGRLRWVMDSEGYVHYSSYHPDTGGLAYQMTDVDTANLDADITGTGSDRWVEWSGSVPFSRDAGRLPFRLRLRWNSTASVGR